MRILCLTSGPHVPSTRFRVLQYLGALRRDGHAAHVSHSFPAKYEQLRCLGWRGSELLRRWMRRLDLLRARYGRFDSVLIERQLFTDDWLGIERRLRRVAKRLVLDVDDAVFLDHEPKFRELFALCDEVIAGNDLLRQRVLQDRDSCVVVPTCVDLGRYQRPAATASRDQDAGRPVVIGWTGTSSNLVSLERVRPVLAKLSRRYAWVLRVIADRFPESDRWRSSGIPVEFRPWRPETEIDDLMEIDIGLMPLHDDRWNRYKCGFKLIQYMALGIPAVASPVGINPSLLVGNGPTANGQAGLLAESEAEWADALEKLLSDRASWAVLGQAGRARVEREYSIQARYPQWLAAVTGESDAPSAG